MAKKYRFGIIGNFRVLKLINRSLKFLKKKCPPSIKQFIKGALSQKQIDFVQRLLNSKKGSYYYIEGIRKKLLNLGFSKRAKEDLELIVKEESNIKMKSIASWELLLWHANQYNKDSARESLKLLAEVVKDEKDSIKLRQAVIMEAENLEITGDIGNAKKAIINALDVDSDSDLFLALSNLESTVDKKISLINKALPNIKNKVSFSEKKNSTLYDCLFSDYEKQLVQTETNINTKVTVIIPVFNAEKVIKTALDSVLTQTWTNLEVLVVDDCSSDKTVDIVEMYEENDDRVKLIKAGVNQGPYVARNMALKEATGEFVTCHDADDWSHSEKIERQVVHLQKNRSVIGNLSEQARATEDLKFYRRGKLGSYIFSNMSSFMFRRKKVMEAVGFWDSVRFGADSEFIRRTKVIFGEDSVAYLSTGPLSFQRQTTSSLTGSSAFGYHGFFMGARKEYFEAFSEYHSLGKELRYDFPMVKRPFAVPEPMWPKRDPKQLGTRYFDIIIVSDFRLDGGSNISNLEEIKAHRNMGLKTGLIQMSRYDYNPRKKTNPKIRQLIDGNMVQMIVFGENVTCDLLIVRYPPILQEWQDYIPKVDAKNIRVIINQTPRSDYGPDGVQRFDIRQSHENLRKYFLKEAIWHPIGPLVREALYNYHSKDLSVIKLATEDWTNIIDVNEWRVEKKFSQGGKPKIGRVSRDNSMKWPDNVEQLLSIYPDSKEFDVYILGGANTPRSILGRLPSNWKVYEFGEIEPKEFLSRIDVFVYYTHQDWVESFGRVIIEAMAVGVPVILPYEYQSLFKGAAIYAEPHEVKEKIQQLLVDKTFYDNQVNFAWKFVEENFGYTNHEFRISKFLSK